MPRLSAAPKPITVHDLQEQKPASRESFNRTRKQANAAGTSKRPTSIGD